MCTSLRAEKAELLDRADELLAIIASEPLSSVTEYAKALGQLAKAFGALEIASRAYALGRVSSGREQPVSLTAAIHDLSESILKARQEWGQSQGSVPLCPDAPATAASPPAETPEMDRPSVGSNKILNFPVISVSPCAC